MTILRGRRVVLPDGVRAVDIEIRDGRITAITDSAHAPHVISGVIDAGDLVVLPGLVDSHVHVNEPGRTDWEGFVHATRAAAAGGVTTIVDMPLNSMPATTTVEALDTKRRAAARRVSCGRGVLGRRGAGQCGSARAARSCRRARLQVFSLSVGSGRIPACQREATSMRPCPCCLRSACRCSCTPNGRARCVSPRAPGAAMRRGSRAGRRLPSSRPSIVSCAWPRDHGAWIHVVHLASPAALETITAARARGVAITVETCPHYLTFAAESIREGATTFKCAPPIRTAADRDGLWRGLMDGEIDLVASDHSPSPPALKCLDTGDFVQAWGGIASLQVSLSAVWTGARERGLGVECLAEWMAAAPARLAGIDGVKGRIAVGCDADLVLFDPAAVWTVDPHQLYHRHALTPYEGMTLTGQVRTTFLRGQIVYDARVGTGAPRGKLLTGPRARVE